MTCVQVRPVHTPRTQPPRPRKHAHAHPPPAQPPPPPPPPLPPSGKPGDCTTCNKPETFLNGEDYHGSDLVKGGLKSSSASDCCNMCKQNPKCQYWTYGTGPNRNGRGKNKCWLKKNTSGHEKQKNRVSGRVCRKKKPRPAGPPPPQTPWKPPNQKSGRRTRTPSRPRSKVAPVALGSKPPTVPRQTYLRQTCA